MAKEHKIMFTNVILLAGLLFIHVSSASAAVTQSYFHQRRDGRMPEMKIRKRYLDRLFSFRDSLYADSVKAPQLRDIDVAPLFLPFTFYHGVANRAFSLDRELEPIDEDLLKLYLNHPDLVVNTESRLDKLGPVVVPRTVTENPSISVEKTLPKDPEAIPVDLVVFKPNFWTIGGDYYLQFLQNYLTDNWYQGGESNYSMLGTVTLTANYKNTHKVKWDNILEMKLGMQTTKSDSIHKAKPTEDLLRYTGKLGLQATKRWYYTFQLVAQTQWARHYASNSRTVQSDFCSPFNLNLSLGMDYSVDCLKGRLKGSVHLAPLAYNFKYVGRLSLATQNGIESGHHALNDYGSQVTVDLAWKFADNITWKTRLYGYTAYDRMEAEWENTFSFQFNKYLATQLYLYPRFDDGRTRDEDNGYWMFKEFVSIGFSYSL